MNELLRARILRKLDTLTDERAYQVLDYIEFLESKYAVRQGSAPNMFQRFAEGVEDSLRAGRVSTAAIAETMGLMSRAMGILSGVAAAGRSVATDVAGTAAKSGTRVPETLETPTDGSRDEPRSEPVGGATP